VCVCVFFLCGCFSVEIGEPLVKTAAATFRKQCYDARERAIAGIICAGWDSREGGQVGGACYIDT